MLAVRHSRQLPDLESKENAELQLKPGLSTRMENEVIFPREPSLIQATTT